MQSCVKNVDKFILMFDYLFMSVNSDTNKWQGIKNMF
jgi:hypothetical protein